MINLTSNWRIFSQKIIISLYVVVMKANNILELIGNTPHLRINHLFDERAEVWLKLEKNNPGGSIKDRIALSMIEDGISKGIISKDTTIVEPTSGNTGIGLAIVCAIKSIPLILVMPESMSLERRRLLSLYGAKLVLTPAEMGMKGAISKARELVDQDKRHVILDQFSNKSNIAAHIKTTAVEILNDFPEGFDYLITGVGTGGHITGCAQVLKEKFPNLKVYAVEPEKSPVLSGGVSGRHRIQGIGAGFIPDNYDSNLIDGVIQITEEEAFYFAKEAAI